MLIKVLEPDFTHNDERGSLVQLVRGGYTQVNVIRSAGGSRRGGHYHKLNTETFYIINGRVGVTVSLDDTSESYTFGPGDMFAILPGVVHDFSYLEESVLIGMYDIGVETRNAAGEYQVTDLYAKA